MDLNVSDSYTDGRGFTYTGMSQPWKDLCEDLPCSRRVHFPNYVTQFGDFNIHGEDIVIQVWRGNCPKGFALRQMPGGIGGEVGIYKRDPDRRIPAELDLPISNIWSPAVRDAIRLLLSPFIRLVIGGVQEATDRWWPHKLSRPHEIGMELTNPEANGELLFSTNTGSGNNGPEPAGGYWLSRWMSYSSFDTYKDRQRVQHDDVPTWAVNYHMEFNVGPHRFRWADKDSPIVAL